MAISRLPRGKVNRYYTIGGVKYPSVTTILSVINKPYLTNWKVKLGKEESEKISGEAADIGLYVHKAIECYNKGKAFPMPEDKEQQQIIRRAVRDYRKWLRQTGFEPLKSELIVYSEQYKYAGTLDCVGFTGDSILICDYKTSKAIWPENKLQLSAYWRAYWEMTGELPDKLWILRFSKVTGRKSEFYEIEESPYDLFAVFLNALSLWKYLNGAGVSKKGGSRPNIIMKEGKK